MGFWNDDLDPDKVERLGVLIMLLVIIVILFTIDSKTLNMHSDRKQFTSIATTVVVPKPIFKYKVGDIVESVVSKQRGVILRSHYYTHDDYGKYIKAYKPLYDVRFSTTSTINKLDGNIIIGAKNSITSSTPFYIVKHINEFEIKRSGD